MENQQLQPSNNQVALTQEEILAKLKEGSDEAVNVSNYPFIPILEIDNSKEVKQVDGEDVEILCKPRWKMTTKENGELVKTPYSEKFGAVVLKVRYGVSKKYDPNSKEPNFYSTEFSPACFSSEEEKITLKLEEGESIKMSYKDFKQKYQDKYKLTMVLYVWHQEQIMKVKLKGASMSAFWDFQKKFKGKDSVCAHVISFGSKRENKPLAHNKAELSIIDPATIPEGKVDFIKILEVQTELNSAFEKFKEKEETIQAELIEATIDEEAVEGEVVAEM